MEGIGLGVLIGIGLAGLTRAYRPVAKGAIKLGITAAEALKDAVSEGKETLADLFAEAKQEIDAGSRAAAAAEARGSSEPPVCN